MSTIILLTPVEVASTLRISRALAYRLVAQGCLPSVRFGRVVRIRQSDLDQFIQTHLSNSLDDTAGLEQGV